MKRVLQLLFAALALISAHAVEEIDSAVEEYLAWTKEQAATNEGKTRRLAIYNQWKRHAKTFVENDNKAHFELTKDLSADIEYSNMNADKYSCSPSEVEGVDTKLSAVFEGILASNGLDINLMIGADPDDERKLYSSAGCPWWCQQWRGRRRRRLQDDTSSVGTLYLRDVSPEGLESFKKELEADMKMQCESILQFVAHTSSNIQHSCHVAMAAAECTIEIDIYDAVKLVNDDGEVETAAEFINTAEDDLDRRNLRKR